MQKNKIAARLLENLLGCTVLDLNKLLLKFLRYLWRNCDESKPIIKNLKIIVDAFQVFNIKNA